MGHVTRWRWSAGAAVIAALGLATPAAPAQGTRPVRVSKVMHSGPSKTSLDVLFVGDGYTAAQLALKYWKDVNRYTKVLLRTQPFAMFRRRINVGAVMLASRQKGCDVAPDAERVATALESHFDAPSGRLLVFKDHARLKQVLESVGIPDIVFVMVNTEKYGGAGTVLHAVKVRGRSLPAPTFSARDSISFQIALHELGHSFGDLTDSYEEKASQKRFKMPKGDKDLRYANATLPAHFDDATYGSLKKTVKWNHFLSLPGAERHRWIWEGGYYRTKGVFRPWPTCRMLKNASPFCPVCEEQMAKALVAACGDTWDDAAYHKARPLKLWKLPKRQLRRR